MNVLDFIGDETLTPGSFKGPSYAAWRAVLGGAFGLPLDKDQRAIFDRLAGGRTPPTSRVRELWVAAGRRSSKTEIAAGLGVHLATIGAAIEGMTARLSPGERGVVAIVAVDRPQARVALQYITGMIEASPVLAQMVEKSGPEGVHFNNRVSIEVMTNSFRSVRGRTLLACILDEVAFYRSDTTANPDVETYRALVPGLATTGGMLIGISSPHARSGLLYDKWRKHFGKDGDILVVQGATKDFNPTIEPRVIADAEADDPDAARAEWHGQFRNDVAGFVSRDVIEAVTRSAPLELPYDRAHRYHAFTDPSGGGKDEFCIAIGHVEDQRTVIDVVRGQRGTPAEIVAEFSELLRDYRISEVTGDKFAGSWPADEFARHRVRYVSADRPKSELYRDSLAALNSAQAELPADPKLTAQFCALERRTARGGRDSIDHPAGGHDDRANVVAGLLAAKRPKNRTKVTF